MPNGYLIHYLIKRVHHLGPPYKDRHSPRPVIIRYLNYMDRVAILKSFHNAKLLQLDGHKVHLFADYSQEVACSCKAFQPICAALYQKGVKFTLAFPAVLWFTDPAIDPKSSHPEEEANYLQAYIHIPLETQPMTAPSYSHGNRDLCSPRKDSPKRACYPNKPKHDKPR